ncbi:snf5 smarcb1 ini1 [Pyrenophora seminiperda CCB06]|uniref:Snf5 smarcb1 ini1 n=1 Tax=Pyrenophora seminiperda CCB06 TaxID=1302712 RepID=A0A3M7M386_9PLEO|nr:snf5 smarcb1 ini1 [Pyrenophora seminiperda CCB06]
MDIQPFRPEAPLPTPSNAREFGINENLPAYKQPDVTPAYRLKDSFLWNLHEALTTPDQFAKQFVDELDLPIERKPVIISQIANQIRQQLEEYAGVALHPLFHATASPAIQGVQATGAKVTLPERREWVNAMTHSIYEAVLRLKKEACENGGLVGDGEIDNDAVEPTIGAGWRYDQEHLCDEWEPKVEILSPEEIEKREGDRERQIRRLRRETARFSSTTNMTGTPANEFFNNIEGQENMGRGERSKKKRRFRSLSPVGRVTPGAGGGSGYGGQDGGLQEGLGCETH